MPTDLKLDDASISVDAPQVFISRSDLPSDAVAINLKSDKGFWHLSGPRAESGNPLSLFWNDLSKWSGPFLSIKTNGQVKIGGLEAAASGRIGIGTAEPQSSLHVHGQEVLSTGSVGGFSFSDRKTTNEVPNQTAGERWVWYAVDKVAHLWSAKNLLSITENGEVSVPQLSTPRLKADGVNAKLISTEKLSAFKLESKSLDFSETGTLKGGGSGTASLNIDAESISITTSNRRMSTFSLVITSSTILLKQQTTVMPVVKLPNAGDPIVSETVLDLVEEIKKLRADISSLQAKVK